MVLFIGIDKWFTDNYNILISAFWGSTIVFLHGLYKKRPLTKLIIETTISLILGLMLAPIVAEWIGYPERIVVWAFSIFGWKTTEFMLDNWKGILKDKFTDSELKSHKH